MKARILARLTFCLVFCLLVPFITADWAIRKIDPPHTFKMSKHSELAQYTGWGPRSDSNLRPLCDAPHAIENKDNRTRILLLGDSVLDCNEDSQRYVDTVPAILGKMLGSQYEIINLSAGAWGTDQELIAYRKLGRKYRAQHVMLFFTPANDLFNNSAEEEVGTKRDKPYFSIQDGRLVEHPLVKSSGFGMASFFNFGEIGRRMTDATRSWPPDFESEFFANHSGFMTPLPHRIEKGWVITQMLLRTLAKEVSDDGGKLSIVYVPTGYRRFYAPNEKASASKCVGYSSERPTYHWLGREFSLNIYQPLELMKRFSVESGIPLIENVAQFERYGDKHDVVSYDCLHLNALGSRLLVERVRDWCQSPSKLGK